MVMASAGVNLPGGDGSPAAASSSAPECRLRRRRRLAPPRAAATTAAGSGAEDDHPGAAPGRGKRGRPASPSSPSSGSADGGDEEEAAPGAAAEEEEAEQEEGALAAEDDEEPRPPATAPVPVPLPRRPPARAWPVAFGSMSMAGRMRDMEDAVSLHPGLCTWADGSPMHFFAVFDGHGGSHVSALCRDRMHVFLAEELAAEAAAFLRRQQQAAAGAGPSSSAASGWRDEPSSSLEEEEEERAWRAALSRSFRRVDALAALACACGRVVARPPCRCPLSRNAAGIVGSTAVVALLVRGRLVVANCGDSRAVLCRGAAGAPPVPLSLDHKPDRPDELARIEAAGGRVVYINGPRVRGILAMSRALGDRMLRPEVIAEPEITVTERTAEDECLILASDGMWDVISNETACSVARQCLEDGNTAPSSSSGGPAEEAAAGTSGEAGSSSGGGGAGAAAAEEVGHETEPRCDRAASLLARLAIGRMSSDNISVVVIDLKQRDW